MVDGRLLHRIVVWPTYEDAVTAEQEADNVDCKRTNKLTVWPTYEQAAAHASAGSGGGGDYHADSVHWDGTSYLHNDVLASGEHNKLSFAVWFRIPSGQGAFPIAGFWITDAAAFNFSYGEANPAADDGFGGMQFTLIDVDQTTYIAESRVSDGSVKPALNTWYAYVGSVDCSTSLGSILAYLNDANASGNTSNLGGPSAVIQGNGVPIRIGTADPGGDQALDMANFLMWYGQAIDWSVEANRRFIIDASGKPVDPALAIAEFGAPTVALIGDATAFQSNQGSGGSFALSGSLTNASTSPSD